MWIKLDDEGYIIATNSMTMGDDSILFEGEIPDDFAQYQLIEGEIILGNREIEDNSELIAEMESLRRMLNETDWKVSRQQSSENHRMPEEEYDDFIAERDSVRDRINEIESILEI